MTALFLRPNQFRKEVMVDDIFNDFVKLGFNWNQRDVESDVTETDTGVTVTIDVPGYEKSDISIDYKDDTLVVAASSDKNNRHEIKRRFLIRDVDLKKSNADLKNGVLTIRLTKVAEAQAQTLKIT